MSPGQSVHLLLEIVSLLNREGISYAVIGALAASFFGVVRGSLDADAVLSLKDSDITPDQLFEALKWEGFSASLQMGDPSDPLLGLITVQDSIHNRVDLILGIRGMDPAAFSRTVETSVFGSPIRIVGVEDFIAMKIFAGGPVDISDVRGALKVSRSMIRMDLLKQLADRFGSETRASLETLLLERG